MIQPPDIEDDLWKLIIAAAAGDAPTCAGFWMVIQR